jgi:hypothetical protein
MHIVIPFFVYHARRAEFYVKNDRIGKIFYSIFLIIPLEIIKNLLI